MFKKFLLMISLATAPAQTMALSCVLPAHLRIEDEMSPLQIKHMLKAEMVQMLEHNDEIWIGTLTESPAGSIWQRQEVRWAKSAWYARPFQQIDQKAITEFPVHAELNFYVSDAYRFSGQVLSGDNIFNFSDTPTTLQVKCADIAGATPCPVYFATDTPLLIGAKSSPYPAMSRMIWQKPCGAEIKLAPFLEHFELGLIKQWAKEVMQQRHLDPSWTQEIPLSSGAQID